MVIAGGWGGINPIPLVRQGALRDWLEQIKGIRQTPQVSKGIVYTPASLSRTIAMAFASAGFMAAYARVVGVPSREVDYGQLHRDVQAFLRSTRGSQVRPQPRKRKPQRGAPPMAPLPLEPPDLEEMGFLSWIERRRYRDGGYYTPDVKGTI